VDTDIQRGTTDTFPVTGSDETTKRAGTPSAALDDPVIKVISL
jgi:hypothetical protein